MTDGQQNKNNINMSSRQHVDMTIKNRTTMNFNVPDVEVDDIDLRNKSTTMKRGHKTTMTNFMKARNPRSLAILGQMKKNMYEKNLQRRYATDHLLNNSKFYTATHSKITKKQKGQEINILSL
jgi:hypothetical protein